MKECSCIVRGGPGDVRPSGRLDTHARNSDVRCAKTFRGDMRTQGCTHEHASMQTELQVLIVAHRLLLRNLYIKVFPCLLLSAFKV